MSQRIVFGVGPVRELLRAHAKGISAIFVQASRAQKSGADPVAEIVTDAKNRAVFVEARASSELDTLAGPGNRHQGVVAITGAFRYADVDDVVDAAEADGRRPLLVALDGVQDPHNLGAIIRSAYLLGADAVLVPEHRAAAVTPTVTKSSAGATELLPISQVKNLVRTLDDLKRRDVWIAAVASSTSARPLSELDGNLGLCVVMGAEGSGVRPLIAKQADFSIEIPMAKSGVGSFNVSVATAIALYEIARQRALAAE